MKKFLLTIIITCFYTAVFAQVTFTQLPETPLTYLGYEITSPTIKAGYNKRTQYFGSSSASIEIGSILQKKFSDLPIYSYFSELSDFIGYVESRTTITRTAGYVAYVLEAKASSSGAFATYAKDTFFLSGTTITSISETIYDTEDNTVDTYTTYDVFYHANGKIERIKFKKSLDDNSVYFSGVYVAYNANNTLKTDSTFKYQYDGSGSKKSYPSIYQDHTYKASNQLQLDSTFYYYPGSNPELNTKFSYTLNTSNEILKAKGFTYSSASNKYENTFRYEFGLDPSLGILSQSNVSTISLYPNPVQDLITIPADCMFQSWSITSITGSHIKSGTNTDLNKISVIGLEAGVYVLTLSNNEQTWTGKFIK